MQDKIGKANRVCGAQCNATPAWCVWESHAVSMNGVAPRTEAPGLSQFQIDIVLQLDAGEMPQDNRRHLRGSRSVGISGSRLSPQRNPQGAEILVQRIGWGRKHLQVYIFAIDNAGIRSLAMHSSRHCEQVSKSNIGLQWIA